MSGKCISTIFRIKKIESHKLRAFIRYNMIWLGHQCVLQHKPFSLRDCSCNLRGKLICLTSKRLAPPLDVDMPFCVRNRFYLFAHSHIFFFRSYGHSSYSRRNAFPKLLQLYDKRSWNNFQLRSMCVHTIYIISKYVCIIEWLMFLFKIAYRFIWQVPRWPRKSSLIDHIESIQTTNSTSHQPPRKS